MLPLDFPLGLDFAYSRLFIEYLKEYATVENKMIFLTYLLFSTWKCL